jgi:ERCC4-type nuclease
MDRVTIIADTREREVYSFDPARVDVVRRALAAGDYSVAGLEDRVAVERKSLDDFVSTVIRSRERFGRELDRLRQCEAACVVVEGSLADVFAGRYRGGAHPASVFGAVISIIVDRGIPVFFCHDRQHACRFTSDYLIRFYQKTQEDQHAEP